MTTPQDTHSQIRDILVHRWNPIGLPVPHDEYDAYIPTLYRYIMTHKPAHTIADYLTYLTTVHMQLAEDKQHTQYIAQLLCELNNNDTDT